MAKSDIIKENYFKLVWHVVMQKNAYMVSFLLNVKTVIINEFVNIDKILSVFIKSEKMHVKYATLNSI